MTSNPLHTDQFLSMMTQEEVACAGGPHSPVPGIDKLAIPHLSLAFMAAPIVPFLLLWSLYFTILLQHKSKHRNLITHVQTKKAHWLGQDFGDT